MSSDTQVVRELGRWAESLRVAETATDLFKRVLESASIATPRAAIFLVRRGRIRGWGSIGYPPDVGRKQKEFECAVDAGWLGSLAASERPLREPRPPAADPDFAQPAPTERVGVSIRVKGRPIALLIAERTGEQSPWTPSALSLLGLIAELRLELDLARRKLEAPGAAARPEAAAPVSRPQAPSPAESAVGVEQATVKPPPAVVASAGEPAAAGDEPQMSAARRYARLVATDIRLYNEDSVHMGRRRADLVERLGDQLRRGKETFVRRHGQLGPVGLELLYEAYVQVLAGGDEGLLPRSVLD